MHTKNSGLEWSRMLYAGEGESSIKEFAENQSVFGKEMTGPKVCSTGSKLDLHHSV